MKNKEEKAQRLKELSSAIKTNHQILKKCDFYSLFSAEIAEVNKNIAGKQRHGRSQDVIFPADRDKMFNRLLKNLLAAKWNLQFKAVENDYNILLMEKKTTITSKTAKTWNNWLFAWRDKPLPQPIFINLKNSKSIT